MSKHFLVELAQHYPRQVGHTTLMLEGVKNFDRESIVIADNMGHAKMLEKMVGPEPAGKPIFVTPDRMHLAATRPFPIAIDHFALQHQILNLDRDSYQRGLREGMRRHTWMKDGVTYVGNGTYTLKEADEMLDKELKIRR